METNQVTQFATYLRSAKQTNPFAISTSLLMSLSATLENMEEVQSTSSSFHIRLGSNVQMELLRDLQFLCNFFEQTKNLKLYSESSLDVEVLDISKFKNLVSLEISKVDINLIKGIQKIRSQLHSLVCHKTFNNLNDILIRCGADQSNSNFWAELKKASFTNNDIKELDRSFECTTMLHTLDLSHNQIRDIGNINFLVNLKHLNLSFNKLEVIPFFKGQICNRLQNLALKNNFIEDVSGLQSLTNICVLDLSNNCLVEHKSLSSLSHLATLQCLNLENNPLSFHPHHRMKSSSYLHTNVASTNFVLNYLTLSKSERKQIGCFHPIQSKNLNVGASNDDSRNASLDKTRNKAVRHVSIEEESSTKQPEIPILTPTSQQYLETKKQIENLREQYGESWLNMQSGLLVQNVLGIEGSLPISSSPYEADFLIHSNDVRNRDQTLSTSHKSEPGEIIESPTHPKSEENITGNTEIKEVDKTEASYVTAYENAIIDVDEESSSDSSDFDDEEEGLYLVIPDGENDHIFIVITKTHIMEKTCDTNKERIKWHINSITNYQILNDSKTKIKLEFETMRKDRKQRIYNFEESVSGKFISCIDEKIASRLPENNNVSYQCMKCSARFSKIKSTSVLSEPTVNCPICESTLVVEDL